MLGLSLSTRLLPRLGKLSPYRASRAWSSSVSRIDRLSASIEQKATDELRRDSLALRYRALSGERLDTLLVEAYALMREATRRTLGMKHYSVQLLGGIAMHHGAIAEMQTGEGKTLTATLPLYLAALADRGAHLATANDYLAQRDAELMRPAYEMLGMSVGVVESSTPRAQRRAAYACDITYGASREFGFDFLRDRLATASRDLTSRDLLGRMLGHAAEQDDADTVQRELHFALVDEADSILIDDARTPLIVSSLPGNSQDAAAALYQWAAEVAGEFVEGDDYEYVHRDRRVGLRPLGRRRVRERVKPKTLDPVPMFDIYEHVERAIRAQRDFTRDQHYVVVDGEVVIVDEGTGRLAEGRKWREGIHQAVEAKEGVEVTVKTGEAARVTVQDFYLRYDRLAGMTGTAASSRRELKRIYSLRVAVIPTRLPERRERLASRVYGNSDAKWSAVVEEVARVHQFGRPVLIGTRSIDKSEHLSRLLTEAGIDHDVLNAHRHCEEADIVARAGQHGKVTVATNMAGRGTDIQLGDGVAEMGGLHIVCTELHESARIDRQLIGRCARQGDPGSHRQFMALDDEILRAAHGPRVADRYARLAGPHRVDRFARKLRAAQRKVERDHFRQRRLLLYHEKQRRKVQLQMGQDPYLDATM